MKTALRTVVSITIALGLIGLLLGWSGTGLDEVAEALGQLDPRVYWLAFALQLTLYPLRALRTRVLLPDGERVSVLRLIPATAAHILAAYVLPAKMGEATLVVYLRRACGVSGVNALAVLVVSRLLDFAMITGLLALTCFTLGVGGDATAAPWLSPLGLALVVPTVLFSWLCVRSERLVPLAALMLRISRLDRTRLGRHIASFAEQLRSALVELRGGRLLLGMLLTLPVWLIVFLFFGMLARGFGLDALTYPQAVFGAGLAILANLLPVNGFAGFGVQDVGWVAGFHAVGVPLDLATSSGLAAHLVYAFNISVIGLAGQALMGAMPVPAAANKPGSGS